MVRKYSTKDRFFTKGVKKPKEQQVALDMSDMFWILLLISPSMLPLPLWTLSKSQKTGSDWKRPVKDHSVVE